MASSKKRTTFAKLNREQKLRERRLEKQARKDARKLEAASDQPVVDAVVTDDLPTDADVGGDEPTPEMVAEAPDEGGLLPSQTGEQDDVAGEPTPEMVDEAEDDTQSGKDA